MAVIVKATLSTVSGVTTITGTAAQIITEHSNGGASSLGTDFVAIVTGAATAADVTAIAQVKNTVMFVLLGESRELRRLTIGKLLELELSLSYYLSLPSKEE